MESQTAARGTAGGIPDLPRAGTGGAGESRLGTPGRACHARPHHARLAGQLRPESYARAPEPDDAGAAELRGPAEVRRRPSTFNCLPDQSGRAPRLPRPADRAPAGAAGRTARRAGPPSPISVA